MFVQVWEFTVAPEREAEFVRHYGPDGSWAQFFARDPDYLGTLLLGDAAVPGRFLTLDRWRSQAAFRAFRSANALEYQALDRRFESLCLSERELGAYVRIG
jgi:heme-degrading monooxygenase HmoA